MNELFVIRPHTFHCKRHGMLVGYDIRTDKQHCGLCAALIAAAKKGATVRALESIAAQLRRFNNLFGRFIVALIRKRG